MSDLHTMPPPLSSESTNKVSGVVNFYSVQKCYGFIKRNDTNEYVFVHRKSITVKNQRRVTRSLAKGEHVEFDVIMGHRSPEAKNVTGMNGGPVVGSEYGLISMQWHQYNAYKDELLRNGEHSLRDQSPRARRFFHHRRRNNATNHQSNNRKHNQHQHQNNQKAAANQQRPANEQIQNQNKNLDENKPKIRRRRHNQSHHIRRRSNVDNDGTTDKQDQEIGVLEMTESNVTTLLSELNIDNKNAISANSTSSESLDFEKIHNDELNPIPCITSMPTAAASSRLAATFSKGNQ